jgi:hypothetical protein
MKRAKIKDIKHVELMVFPRRFPGVVAMQFTFEGACTCRPLPQEFLPDAISVDHGKIGL